MAPELIAAEAKRSGYGREEAARRLMNAFPLLIAVEIDNVLSTVYGDQNGQPVKGRVWRSGTF